MSYCVYNLHSKFLFETRFSVCICCKLKVIQMTKQKSKKAQNDKRTFNSPSPAHNKTQSHCIMQPVGYLHVQEIKKGKMYSPVVS